MTSGGARSRLETGAPPCAPHEPETAPAPDFHPDADSGAIAQLGERLNGIQEVRGSTPLGSTKHSTVEPLRLEASK